MKRTMLMTLVLLFALVLAACGGAAEPTPAPTAAPAEPTAEPTPEPEPTEVMEEPMGSIVDIAVADGRFTTLVTAVTEAGLAETLAGEGAFTVFAPTDDAFAALPEGTVEGLLADPQGALRDILLYHVVDGKVMAADVVGLTSATSLQGEEIAISVDGGNVMLNGAATVIITDIEASNGVIHVIDSVILPPSMTTEAELPTIAEIAAGDENFSTLVTALDAAGLVETFASEGEFTVFAPTNDAFAALPEGTIPALLEDPQGALTDILFYHVVEGTVLAEDVVTLDSATTLLGEDITIEVVDGGVVLNGTVNVVMTDIMASNGVIHVIDAVLLPPQPVSVVDLLVADERFSTLVTAVSAAGLVEALQGEGPFTIFAPTNDAFAALPEGTLDTLLADPQGALADVLSYHVVAENVTSATIAGMSPLTTLQGGQLEIMADMGTVTINQTVTIIEVDLEGSNGVIHVIDGVLVP